MTPLETRAGFADAVAFLDRELRSTASHGQTAWVIVWPPDQGATVTTLPTTWTVSDSVPLRDRPPTLYVLAPRGTPPPLELAGEVPAQEQLYDDVIVQRYSR